MLRKLHFSLSTLELRRPDVPLRAQMRRPLPQKARGRSRTEAALSRLGVGQLEGRGCLSRGLAVPAVRSMWHPHVSGRIVFRFGQP